MFQAFQSRTLTELELTEPVLTLLNEEVRRAGLEPFSRRRYTPIELQRDTVEGHTRYLFSGGREGHEAKAVVLSWYCEKNHAINVVSVDFIEESPEISEILDSITCG